MTLANEVKQKLEAALPSSKVEVLDFTHQHLDHGTPGAHLEVIIAYSGFKGLPLVEQHQKVYKILSEEFKNKTIHALRIKTETL